jgi:hypothetical protein
MSSAKEVITNFAPALATTSFSHECANEVFRGRRRCGEVPLYATLSNRRLSKCRYRETTTRNGPIRPIRSAPLGTVDRRWPDKSGDKMSVDTRRNCAQAQTLSPTMTPPIFGPCGERAW